MWSWSGRRRRDCGLLRCVLHRRDTGYASLLASIFELNAVMLRYIEASKEAVAGIAAVQDRTEVIRNLAFADLTNSHMCTTCW